MVTGYRSASRPIPWEIIPDMVYEYKNDPESVLYGDEKMSSSCVTDSWWREAIRVADDVENKQNSLGISNMVRLHFLNICPRLSYCLSLFCLVLLTGCSEMDGTNLLFFLKSDLSEFLRRIGKHWFRWWRLVDGCGKDCIPSWISACQLIRGLVHCLVILRDIWFCSIWSWKTELTTISYMWSLWVMAPFVARY